MSWGCGGCGEANPDGTRFCGYCGTARPEQERPDPGSAPVDALVERLSKGQVPEAALGDRPRDQRRLVTALFADISGFTSLADRLDPEGVAEIISAVIGELSDVVGRHDGYVDKYSGDALLAFFGAPVSHEDDVERAVAVALEMHDRLAAVKPGLGAAAQDLGLHIGINTGHAIALVIDNQVRTDYSVLGDAINVAQRLESQAGPGETFVGALTERATYRDFEYESLGPVALKGKAAPVAAWRLLGRRRLPESPSVFVGRHPERDALHQALDRVASLSGEVIVVSGPAGVGKTSLIADARVDAQRRGFRWLDARAISYRAGSPYAPIVDLLIAVADDGPESADPVPLLRAKLADLGLDAHEPALVGLLESSWSDDQLEPEARRVRIDEAVCALFATLATREPLVVAFEDLHWADRATVEIVASLVAHSVTAPMLTIVSTRPGSSAVDVLHNELAVMPPPPDGIRTTQLSLAAMADDEMLQLIHQTNDGVTAAVARSVLARAGGNPFFAVELIRAIERVESDPGSGDLPPTIETALSVRLDALSADAGRLLDVAAAIGTEVPEAILTSVAGVANVRDSAIKELIAADILEAAPDRAGVLGFTHSLLQEVAYARLLRRHAREVHEQIADEVERRYGRDGDAGDLLAYHLYQADLGDRAVSQLLESAARAEAVFANDTAMLHLRRALELGDRHEDAARHRDDATLRLADLCQHVGAYEDAEALYRSLLTSPSASRAACGLAASLRTQGEYNAALDVLNAAVPTASAPDDAAMIQLERGRALMVIESFDAAIDAFTSGLDTVSDASLRAALLYDLARAESSVGLLDRAVQHGVEARHSFEAAGDRRHLVSALRVLGGVYEDLGRLDEAASTLREGLTLAETIGHAEEVGGCLVNLALVELARGNHDAAVACDLQAIDELDRIGHPALATAYANLAEALLARGDTERVQEYCEHAIALASQRHDMLTVADAGLTAARAELLLGHGEQAAAAAEIAAAHFLEVGSKDWATKAMEIAAQGRAAAERG